jgi:phosphopantetheinyl transferase
MINSELSDYISKEIEHQLYVWEQDYHPDLLAAFNNFEINYLKSLFSKYQKEWVASRFILKQILDFGIDDNILSIKMPHLGVSITHTQEKALVLESFDRNLSIGIDYELRVKAPLESARFFLTEKEQNWLYDGYFNEWELLKIWTIKEACFKAGMDNKKMGLKDFELIEPSLERGKAVCIKNNKILKYVNLIHAQGPLSVAILQ